MHTLSGILCGFSTLSQNIQNGKWKIDVADVNFNITNDRFNVVNVQIASLEQTFGTLSQYVAELQAKFVDVAQPQPQQFAISSPPTGQATAQLNAPAPPGIPVVAQAFPTCGPPQDVAQFNARSSAAAAAQPAAPARPQSFQQVTEEEGEMSPFDGVAGLSPTVYPPQTPAPRQNMADGIQMGQNRAILNKDYPPLPGAIGRAWEISYQKNKSLYMFNATQDTYEDWSEEVFNHLNRTNREWSGILEWVQIQPTDVELTYEALLRTTLGGVRAWDLSTTLDTFLMNWLCKGIKKRRKVMSGGMKGNGFELWRQLFHEFKGTGQMTKNIGRRRFITFGRCNELAKLSQHLDEWQNLLDEFAPDMLQCPETLRSMIDEIIPESIKNELINHDEVVTWKDVIAFCKRRTYHLKQKTLARSSKGKVNALTPTSQTAADQPVPDDDDLTPPAWAKTIIAALSAPPPPHASARPSRGDRGRTTDRKRSDSKGSRSSSRDSSRGSSLLRLKKKFIFRGGCNHCGVEGHQRKDCAEFLAIKAKHNGQLPAGYKGAREKAFDKWFAESKAGKTGDVAKPKPKAKPQAQHVRALAMQAESSDSDFTDDEQCPHIVTALSRCNKWEPVSRGTPLVKAYRSPYLRT